jgi:Cu(I)/Ag(I) efflux system membrane fusion protein
VIALLPQINEQSRTMTARIEISNPKHDLVPGMFVSLDFTATNSTPTLVVPTEAIIVTGERSVVIVARDAGKFDVAEVTVGRESNGSSEILRGLDEGETVVLSGQFLIDSEASLKSTLNRLGESESAHGNATSTMQEQGAHP